MSTLHDFLVEHAKFPFPLPDELQSVGTTDISDLEVGLLKKDWKALHAIRDPTLTQKLCHTLENILGDTPLEAEDRSYLLTSFIPMIQVDECGAENRVWSRNPSEVRVSCFINISPFEQHELNSRIELDAA